jgi:hypothetical protein
MALADRTPDAEKETRMPEVELAPGADGAASRLVGRRTLLVGAAGARAGAGLARPARGGVRRARGGSGGLPVRSGPRAPAAAGAARPARRAELIGHLGGTTGYRSFVGRVRPVGVTLTFALNAEDDPTPLAIPAVRALAATRR